MKKSSIEFTKKNQSVTYLVFDISSIVLVGYFILVLKPLTVRGETVSNTVKKKLLRVSELDESSDTYTMSAYLIAQLGKKSCYHFTVAIVFRSLTPNGPYQRECRSITRN